MTVAPFSDARHISRMDYGLAAVATIRPDGTAQLTVVNAGIIPHPVDGRDVAAFVAHAGARKLDHLRHNPTASVLWRAGWSWVTVEGTAQLCGPDDPMEGVGPTDLRHLLRTIAEAAGAQHHDWEEYDRLVAAERRTAVLVTPRRSYQNP